jgi:hypothetical protein
MLSALADLALRRPWRLLAANVAVAAALLAVGALAWTRRPGSLLAVLAARLPAAGALGACVFVFQD